MCKAGDKCLFPHNKVEEQPSQKPKKSLYSQNGKSEDKGAGQGDGVRKAGLGQAAAAPRGSRTFVCEHFLFARWHMPRRKNQAARKWSPCGTENRQHHLSWKCAWVTGKAGENCQNSVEMGGTIILDKSVGSRCGDTLKASASFGLI